MHFPASHLIATLLSLLKTKTVQAPLSGNAWLLWPSKVSGSIASNNLCRSSCLVSYMKYFQTVQSSSFLSRKKATDALSRPAGSSRGLRRGSRKLKLTPDLAAEADKCGGATQDPRAGATGGLFQALGPPRASAHKSKLWNTPQGLYLLDSSP